MPTSSHYRERTNKARGKYISIRVTDADIENIDSFRMPNETRTEFVFAALEAYTMKRKKRNEYHKK